MMSMLSASLLILNGKDANEPQSRGTANLLHDEGIDVYVRVIWEKGDAVRFIDKVLQLNVGTVTAGGSDGTINGVATAPVKRGSKMALGILPSGTANDFAISVGIPQDLVSALKLAIVGRDVPIDITRVNDKTSFINMATGGSDTRITIETPEELRIALGDVSYLIHGLIRMNTLKLDHCKIRGKNFHWQGDVLVTGIGNGHQAGGGQQLYPEALTNDGLPHLCIFTGEELILVLFSTLVSPENSPDIVDDVSSWFEITAPREVTPNLDGEPLSSKTSRMELPPAALRYRLPPSCSLLR